MSYARVVLFGDTVAQRAFDVGGWGSRLADHFQRRVDVLSRGLEGYNTRWAKILLPKVFPAGSAPASADVVVVCFGAIDSALPVNKAHHVPVEEFKSNIKDICTFLMSDVHLLNSSIVLVTPPSVSEDMWAKTCRGKGVPMDRRKNAIWEYSIALKQLGKELSIETVDFFSKTGMSKEPHDKLFTDGFHLASRSSEMLAGLLIPILEPKVNVKERVFPDWTAIDPKEPAKVLC